MTLSNLAFQPKESYTCNSNGYDGSLLVKTVSHGTEHGSMHPANNVIKFPSRAGHVANSDGRPKIRLGQMTCNFLFDDELTLHSMLRDSETLSCIVSSDPAREEAVSEFFRTVISLDDDEA